MRGRIHNGDIQLVEVTEDELAKLIDALNLLAIDTHEDKPWRQIVRMRDDLALFEHGIRATTPPPTTPEGMWQ